MLDFLLHSLSGSMRCYLVPWCGDGGMGSADSRRCRVVRCELQVFLQVALMGGIVPPGGEFDDQPTVERIETNIIVNVWNK